MKDILSHLHHIPAPDTDQCALSRLGLDAIFAQSQPYNIKSTQCQIQARTSDAISLDYLNAVVQLLVVGHSMSSVSPRKECTGIRMDSSFVLASSIMHGMSLLTSSQLQCPCPTSKAHARVVHIESLVIVQGAVSSNPVGCKKINGGNNTAAAGCGINTAIGTQPAFATSIIRNASLLGPKNYLVVPPELPPKNQRRHLLSTEISASPLASYTNISGQGPTR